MESRTSNGSAQTPRNPTEGAMAAITVPEKDQKALGELASLSGRQIVALIDALKVAQPTLLMRELAAKVAPKAGMDVSETLRFIRLLATMYAVRVREGLTVDQFAEEILRATDKAGVLQSEQGQESFKGYLRDLLSIESLFVTAKALEISREHEHRLCEPRILTDMRPIFGLDDEPVAVVPVHMLRIAYHEGYESTDAREFFVALTSDNIRELKRLLNRAEAKETKLRNVAEKSGLMWLERSGKN